MVLVLANYNNPGLTSWNHNVPDADVDVDADGLSLQVFDALKARLQESNSKVNLRALEALQTIIAVLRDSLAPVLNILIPAVVDNHLNSKNSSISTAALGAVQALMHNIGELSLSSQTDLSWPSNLQCVSLRLCVSDNSLLLQPFCSKAQYLSGKAKLDLIEKVAGESRWVIQDFCRSEKHLNSPFHNS